MKTLFFIFGFYLITLSLLPCSDAWNDCGDERVAVQVDEHSHNEDSDDNCSPFCYCNCCNIAGSYELPVFFAATARPLQIGSLDFPLYTFALPSSFNGSIWQPPRA